MLKGMAALWLGGWRGLGRKAVASPMAVAAAKAPPPPQAQPKAGEQSRPGAVITHTYYNAQGQVVMVCHECLDWHPTVTRYEFV
jgi:hypothetical protein